MKSAFPILVLVLIVLLFCLPAAGHAVPISGMGAWGSFLGSIVYSSDQYTGEGEITVELTNTSPAANGGYITGLAFSNPRGDISSVAFSDSVFQLLGAPDFDNGINASPLGFHDIGAALGGSWQGGGDPQPGIGAGETRAFVFTISGEALFSLNGLSFVDELAQGGCSFFAVRFRGFKNGESDKVPADEVTVPVTLSSFTAEGRSEYIEINWISQTEIDALAYHLYRGASADGQFLEIAVLDAHGNSEIRCDYSYQDTDVQAGQSYFYKLADEDFEGNVEFHGPVSASLAATASNFVPRSYSLQPNYPNPFNASTLIAYQMPVSGWATLTVYDVLGRTVCTLVDGYQDAGSHSIRWDSRDNKGREAKSGVYFCVFEAGSFSETIKMVLSR